MFAVVREKDEAIHGLFCLLCNALLDVATHGSQGVLLHLKESHDIQYDILPCRFCNSASCTFEDLMKHHNTEHPDEAPLRKCNLCKCVSTDPALPAHKVAVHGLAKCHKCKTFLPKNKLHNHILTEHAIKCMYCDMTFLSYETRRTHLKMKHQQKCWYCTEVFVNKAMRAKHMQKRHSFPCDNCRAIFPCEEKLHNHIIECSEYAEEYQLVCPFYSPRGSKKCNQRFNSYQMLQRHIFSRHKQGRPAKEKYKCKSCGLQLRTGSSLAMHLKYRVCQAECQVMSKSKASAEGKEGPQKNPTLKKLKEENQETASESDGEICVD